MPKTQRLPDGRSGGKITRKTRTANHVRARGQKTIADDVPDLPVDAKTGLPPVPDARAMPPDIEHAKTRAYDGMRRYGTKVYASRFSGIGRLALNQLLKDDAEFRIKLIAARQELYDQLETAMALRGMEPKGDLAGIFILKHSRNKFREGPTRVELSGAGGGPVQVTDTVRAELLDQVLRLKRRAGLSDKTELIVDGVATPVLMAGPAGSKGSGGSKGSRAETAGQRGLRGPGGLRGAVGSEGSEGAGSGSAGSTGSTGSVGSSRAGSGGSGLAGSEGFGGSGGSRPRLAVDGPRVRKARAD